MTSGNISAIGYDPLGGLGLNMGGMYSSYNPCCSYGMDYMMPNMYNMSGMYGAGLGSMAGIPGMYGMNGMYGMYGTGIFNPDYMMQMGLLPGKIQAQSEINKANHMNNMQNLLINNDIALTEHSHKAIVQKILSTDASIMRDIDNLYAKVQSGDMDGTCKVYKDLKNQIYHTYKDDLKAQGIKENPSKATDTIIKNVYFATKNSNLEDDILQKGDGAFANGFYQAFRSGWHKNDKEEALYECFGTPIDHKQSNDTAKAIGKVCGNLGNVVKYGGIGAGLGLGATFITGGAAKLIGKPIGFSKIIRLGKWCKWGAWAGLAAGVVLAGIKAFSPKTVEKLPV